MIREKVNFDYRPSYVLSGARECPCIDIGGEWGVPSVASKRFARLPCFELLCTNMLSDMESNGPSTLTCVAITIWNGERMVVVAKPLNFRDCVE